MSDVLEYCDKHQEEYLQFLQKENANEKIKKNILNIKNKITYRKEL